MTFKNVSSLLLLVFSAYCSYYLYTKMDKQADKQVAPNQELPLFSSKNIKTTSYNAHGIRSHSLESEQLDHYQSTDETHFKKPLLYTFKSGKEQEWRISADDAVLKNKLILEMRGNVQLYNLLPDVQLKEITTDSITIHLTSRDFWTHSETHVSGMNFTTRGNRAEGNFDSHSVELLEKVNTLYDSKIH